MKGKQTLKKLSAMHSELIYRFQKEETIFHVFIGFFCLYSKEYCISTKINFSIPEEMPSAINVFL